MNSYGHRYQTLLEDVVVQLSRHDTDMPALLEYYPGSVAISNITAEWEKPSGNGVYTRIQFPLNLSWVFTIQKIQGETFKRLVIGLGAGERCSGLMLVELSRVRMSKHLLLKPLTFELLCKVNTSSGLFGINNTLATL